MRNLPDDRQIYVSSRLWHEIYSKVNLPPFIFALHEGIDLSKYGDGLKKFYFTFIIVTPADKVNQAYTHYDKKERSADIAIAIPYDQAEKASESELIKLMEQAYLQGIDQLHQLRLKGEFDICAFRKDVEAIFSVDNWYELAMEPSH